MDGRRPSECSRQCASNITARAGEWGSGETPNAPHVRSVTFEHQLRLLRLVSRCRGFHADSDRRWASQGSLPVSDVSQRFQDRDDRADAPDHGSWGASSRTKMRPNQFRPVKRPRVAGLNGTRIGVMDSLHMTSDNPAEHRRSQFRAATTRRRRELKRIEFLAEPELAEEFRALVRLKGDSIQDVLEKAVQQYVNRNRHLLDDRKA